MTLDETQLAETLHGIEVDVSPDLASRVRAGGRRRLMRRRSMTAAGAVAVGAAAVPTVLVLHNSSGDALVKVGSSPNSVGLFAAPPETGAECNAGYGAKAPASAHPDLLLLPPAADDVRYAFVREQTSNCDSPHVALTAYQRDGDSIGAGIVIEGPNAPTPTQAGRQGPHIDFFGTKGDLPIDGQPAAEYSIDQIDHTDAYWTEPDGGQWHAVVRDLSQQEAVNLLNRMAFDGRAGTATLPDATRDGWTLAPESRDRAVDETGWVISQWTDSAGHLVDMTVTQTPDRTLQTAIDSGSAVTIGTVRGHTAMLAPSGGNGGNAFSLTWEEAKDVQVQLSIKGGTAAEIGQVAESLRLASPDDPRFALQGG